MEAFDVKHLMTEREQSEKPYLEFLRVPDLSMGLYALKCGEKDPQHPHQQDEVYYVLRGKGKIRVGDQDRDVQAGSIVYVPKRMEHRFHAIVEDLQILVFFAPAETLSE